MSSRNHHAPCHKKISCPSKKTHRNSDHCSNNNKSNNNNNNACRISCPDDPCSAACGNGLGVGGDQPLRNQLSDALFRQQQNINNNAMPSGGAKTGIQYNIEAEVDRLVDCAKAWSEKEKFKLKQFYEDEIVRKKKAVIQEFKCAMEREVIAPLKMKICDYEKEIQGLKQQLEQEKKKCQTMLLSNLKGDTDNQNDGKSKDLELVDKALNKIRKSHRELGQVIQEEKRRKSVRLSMGLLQPPPQDESSLEFLPEWSEEPSGAPSEMDETRGKMGWTDSSTIISTTTNAGREGMDEDGTTLDGGVIPESSTVISSTISGDEQESIDKRSAGKTKNDGRALPEKPGVQSKQGAPNIQVTASAAQQSNPKERTSVGSKGAALPRGFEDMAELGINEDIIDMDVVESLLQTGNLNEDTKLLLRKVKELQSALDSTRHFTEEEINDLIKESELMEEFKKKAEVLLVENEKLKRRIDELLKQLKNGKPDGGSVDEENMMLRQRIQELEGDRTRGSILTELNLLKQQLETVWEKNEVEKELSNPEVDQSGLQLIPEDEEEYKQVDASTPKGRNYGPGQETSGSRKNSGAAQDISGSRKNSGRTQEISGSRRNSGPAQETSGSRKNSAGTTAKPLSSTAISNKSGGTRKIPDNTSNKSRSSGGKSRPRQKSNEMSLRSQNLSAMSLGEITGPYQDKIKLLLDRIKELEDHLKAMAELEIRLKELEEQAKEMERLQQQLKELTDEVTVLRAKECPICPVFSDTELRATKKKLENLETLLEEKKRDFDAISVRLQDLEKENTDLGISVMSFRAVEQKHVELEGLHAQLLEEKRRKSLENKDLNEKLAKSGYDISKATENIESLKEQLKQAEERHRNGDEIRRQLEQELAEAKSNLQQNMNGMEDLRRQIQGLESILDDKNNNIEDLKKQIKDKENLLEELRGRNATLQDDSYRAQKKMEEVLRDKEILEKELESVRRRFEQMQSDLMQQLREQQKKCAEATDALSKKGQCILEHEKKCLNVTNQMEKDNEELQLKLRQMEDQLNSMVYMEQRTKALHGEMEAFHIRAQERTRELEELKKLPETCDLKNTTSSSAVLPSPMYSLPSLPTSQYNYTPVSTTVTASTFSATTGNTRDGTSKAGRDECNFLTSQLRDLEREKEDLGAELEGKMKVVQDINRQLDELKGKDRKLRDKKDKACNDDDQESKIP